MAMRSGRGVPATLGRPVQPGCRGVCRCWQGMRPATRMGRWPRPRPALWGLPGLQLGGRQSLGNAVLSPGWFGSREAQADTPPRHPPIRASFKLEGGSTQPPTFFHPQTLLPTHRRVLFTPSPGIQSPPVLYLGVMSTPSGGLYILGDQSFLGGP